MFIFTHLWLISPGAQSACGHRRVRHQQEQAQACERAAGEGARPGAGRSERPGGHT